MAHRLWNSSAIAVIAALTVGLSSGMRAQTPDSTKKVTPTKSSTAKRTVSSKPATSTKRIKVKKETAAGDVALPKPADTTVVTVDTMSRVDTKPDTVAMVDTTTVTPIPIPTADTTTPTPTPPPAPIMRPRHFGAFYIGLAGGASVPSGDIYNGYNSGFNLSVPMGWQPSGSLFGLRLDVSYDRLMARPTFRNNGQASTLVTLSNGTYTTSSGSGTPYTTTGGTSTGTTSTPATTGGSYYNGIATAANRDAALASAMLDAKLRLPIFGSRSPLSLYAVGGGGLHYFFNYDKTLALTNPAAEQAKFAALHQAVTAAAASGTPYSTASYNSSGYAAVTRLGANGGGGFQYTVGAADLFLEGRYVTVFTKDRSTNYWPVVLGVTWR